MATFLPSIKRLGKFVKASLPEASIFADPRIDLTEGLGAKRVKVLLTIRADLHEARLVKNV
jgi:hypothetical protein